MERCVRSKMVIEGFFNERCKGEENPHLSVLSVNVRAHSRQAAFDGLNPLKQGVDTSFLGDSSKSSFSSISSMVAMMPTANLVPLRNIRV